MERVPGVILRELVDSIKNVNDLPQKIIDQMLDYVRFERRIELYFELLSNLSLNIVKDFKIIL